MRRLKLTGHQRYFLPPLRDAKELRNQAFVAFCELLRRLGRLQPVVIFIDDLQWADRDSFTILRALTQQPGAPPVLLVATARKVPEGSAVEPLLREFEEQAGLDIITLGPLSPESTRALVDNLLDPDEIVPAVRRRIADVVVQEAGGNPFFAVELVHHMRTVVLPRGGPDLRIGPSVDTLTQLAKAGGTTDFYPATSSQQLSDTLSAISKKVGSCSFTATQTPPDSSNVAVYVNKQQIAQDPNEGWTYGANPQDIVLTGSYCEQITAGADTNVQILFGCPGAPPFPPFVP